MNTELTELLKKGYQVEKEFIAVLSDEERNAEGTFENWSAKDIIAHNAYWRKHHAEDVLAVLAGKTPTHTEDDQINDQVYSQYKDQSWKDVNTLVDTGLERMGEAIESI